MQFKVDFYGIYDCFMQKNYCFIIKNKKFQNFYKKFIKTVDKYLFGMISCFSSCRIFVDANNAHTLGGEVPVEADKSNKIVVEINNGLIKTQMRLGIATKLSDSEIIVVEVILLWLKF